MIYALGRLDQYIRHSATDGRPLRVASLGAPPLVSSFEPGVEIAESQGLPFKLFTDETEAFGWLGEFSSR